MPWPRLTRYTDDLPDRVNGAAVGPIVLIRPEYRADQGIHAHEGAHVRQWWQAGLPGAIIALGCVIAFGAPALAGIVPMAFAAHPLAYRLSRDYRLWAEAKAYREQMRLPDRRGALLSIDDAAARLADPRYSLGIDIDQAIAYLAKL